MTLIHGRGVRGVVITYSFPSLEKYPYLVLNAFIFCLMALKGAQGFVTQATHLSRVRKMREIRIDDRVTEQRRLTHSNDITSEGHPQRQPVCFFQAPVIGPAVIEADFVVIALVLQTGTQCKSDFRILLK